MITSAQWDSWRDDPLTQACIKMLADLARSQWGDAAAKEAQANYAALFADPVRQARYAALRGRIEGLDELVEALSRDLDSLMEKGADATD